MRVAAESSRAGLVGPPQNTETYFYQQSTNERAFKCWISVKRLKQGLTKTRFPYLSTYQSQLKTSNFSLRILNCQPLGEDKRLPTVSSVCPSFFSPHFCLFVWGSWSHPSVLMAYSWQRRGALRRCQKWNPRQACARPLLFWDHCPSLLNWGLCLQCRLKNGAIEMEGSPKNLALVKMVMKWPKISFKSNT